MVFMSVWTICSQKCGVYVRVHGRLSNKCVGDCAVEAAKSSPNTKTFLPNLFSVYTSVYACVAILSNQKVNNPIDRSNLNFINEYQVEVCFSI